MTNFQEFIAGTNPTDPASKLTVSNLTKAGQDVDLSWTTVPGVDYQVHFSPDLITWQDLLDATSSPIVVTADGAQTTVHMTLPDSVANGRMFFSVDLKW